jgi:hypothetical protein
MNILVKSTAILLLFVFKAVSADESQFNVLVHCHDLILG